MFVVSTNHRSAFRGGPFPSQPIRSAVCRLPVRHGGTRLHVAAVGSLQAIPAARGRAGWRAGSAGSPSLRWRWPSLFGWRCGGLGRVVTHKFRLRPHSYIPGRARALPPAFVARASAPQDPPENVTPPLAGIGPLRAPLELCQYYATAFTALFHLLALLHADLRAETTSHTALLWACRLHIAFKLRASFTSAAKWDNGGLPHKMCALN